MLVSFQLILLLRKEINMTQKRALEIINQIQIKEDDKIFTPIHVNSIKWNYEQFQLFNIKELVILESSLNFIDNTILKATGKLIVQSGNNAIVLPFIYLNSLLSLNLGGYGLSDNQIDYIKDKVSAICRMSRITIGESWAYIPSKVYVRKVIMSLIIGFVCGLALGMLLIGKI
jgi:hypothetical protein